MVAILFSMSLIGCGKPLVKTEYQKPNVPPLPAKPEYYPVTWKSVNGFYCLDVDSAKNNLKNEALRDDREAQLEEIIEGLR